MSSNNTDITLTPSIPITALPLLECTTLSPAEHLSGSSTPFSSSPLSERFEYPFPISRPLLTAAPPTHALSNGSIVPPSGTGRGTDMTTFASFSPHSPPEALRYPSATASASQAPGQTPLADAADASGRRRHSTAGQLCVMASAHSPMPPSLALKQRGLKPVGRKTNSADSSSGLGAAPKV